jgi:hypothetical protein
MASTTFQISTVSAFQHILLNIFPNDLEIPKFFAYYGVKNIVDFLTLTADDFKIPYNTPTDTKTFYVLTPLLAEELVSLQMWYITQPSPDLST